MTEKGPSYLDVVRVVEKCLNSLGVNYVEFHLTPLRAGYKVEVHPQLRREELSEIASCISKHVGKLVELRDYVYGTALIIKA